MGLIILAADQTQPAMPTYTIRDLPPEDRPRERLREIGVDSLSTQELLALVVEKGGKKGQTVFTTVQHLLVRFGGLTKIKEASLEELQKVEGVGLATACKLKAAFRLGEKALAANNKSGRRIETSEDVYRLLKGDLAGKKKENFLVLCLNSRNYFGRLIRVGKVSVGSLNASIVHPREVFKEAIRADAASIILVHNHPSGSSEPSEDDLKITRRLVQAGKTLGIEVIDHVIVAKDGYYSFADHKLLTK